MSASTKWLCDRVERVLEQHRMDEADKGHIPGKLAYLDASGAWRSWSRKDVKTVARAKRLKLRCDHCGEPADSIDVVSDALGSERFEAVCAHHGRSEDWFLIDELVEDASDNNLNNLAFHSDTGRALIDWLQVRGRA